jgi:hypothetical protein
MFYNAMETAEVDIQIYLPPLPVLSTEEGSLPPSSHLTEHQSLAAKALVA